MQQQRTDSRNKCSKRREYKDAAEANAIAAAAADATTNRYSGINAIAAAADDATTKGRRINQNAIAAAADDAVQKQMRRSMQ
jgi:hypothetical protein